MAEKSESKWLVPAACIAAGVVVGIGGTITFMVVTERLRTDEEREAAVKLLEEKEKKAAA